MNTNPNTRRDIVSYKENRFRTNDEDRARKIMDNLLDKLLEMQLGQDISRSRDELMKADVKYNEKYIESENLEEKYENLELSADARKLINEYMECKDIISERAEDLSYISGIKDTILFLNSIGLLKR